MRLSRFVLTYRDVRPGEHVLYDVIGDHYVGVDGSTLDAAFYMRFWLLSKS